MKVIYVTINILLKASLTLFVLLLIYIFLYSSLDIYNNFAYDKAILRPTPYGYTPLIRDPKAYTSIERDVMSGEYVYVVDWLSAYENSIAFAKVKSKLKEGYINNTLLVEANFNPKPVVSLIFLGFILTVIVKRFYQKIKSDKIVQS